MVLRRDLNDNKRFSVIDYEALKNAVDEQDTNVFEEHVREVDGFKLIRTLGKGAFAWCKQAIWKRTGNLVALKFVKKNKRKLRQQIEVETELKALSKIKHPNVIGLWAYNLKCSYPNINTPPVDCYMMCLEFAGKGELFDLLYYPQKGLDVLLARTYFKQLLMGLKAVHEQNFIHRDLKPQNVLLGQDCTLKICDFGSAKQLPEGENTLIARPCGTRGYRAPEIQKVMENKNAKELYGKNSDIFSCGVILFILLHGNPPFRDASVNDKFFKNIIKGKKKKILENF